MNSSSPNMILVSLHNLRNAIEFTSGTPKRPRQYVNRKHISNVANKLRDVLKQAEVLPNNTPGASRVDDPYWYIDVLELLAKSVRGKDGIKYLIETILIIESLLKKIDNIQPETILNLDNAVSMYEGAKDNQSAVSVIEDKELLEMFLYSNSSIVIRRGRLLILIGTYLELFIKKKGYNFNILWEGCNQYTNDYPEYADYVYKIRTARNDAAHESWRTMIETRKSKKAQAVKNALENFPPFKQFLISEVNKMNADLIQ